jgi:hypothetical protein
MRACCCRGAEHRGQREALEGRDAIGKGKWRGASACCSPWRGARLPAAAAVGCLLRDGEEDREAAVAAGKKMRGGNAK